jgi:hypothetical protein
MGRQTFLQGETPTWERGSIEKIQFFLKFSTKKGKTHTMERVANQSRGLSGVCLSVSEISSTSTQMGIISP